MSKNSLKFIVAGAVVIGAVSYLAYAAMKDGWTTYHVAVDDFVARTDFHTQRVRLAGKVADQDVVIGAGRLGAKFALHGHTQLVPVNYKGILPDLFKPACEVVVEGRLDATGTFQAETLMTKCASKYEADSPHAKRTETPEAKS